MPQNRRIFLKNLALGLMKEHLIAGAKIASLPRDITAFLSANYALPPQDTNQKPALKRGTCLCVKERRRSSASMKCNICNRYMCKKHSFSRIQCLECNESDDSD